MKKLSILLLVPVIACAHNVSDNIDIVDLKAMNFPQQMKQDIASYNSEMKAKGFVEKDNVYAAKLMKMRYPRNELVKDTQPGDDELKKSPSEIKTTFIFKPVLPNPISYAGIGIVSDAYVWTGIKEFFDGKDAGMCALSVFDISKVKEHVQLSRSGLTYEINDKPTRITVEGNINSGFMYSVSWYDKNFAREIECANKDMNDSIKTKMIEYAKKVDNA